MSAWELDVFVPGKPAPQGSKHARPIFRGRGADKVFTGKVAQVESSKSGVTEWRADVRAACLAVWGERDPLDGPLMLNVEFVRKRPVSTPKRSTPAATTAPDLSKYLRSTEDAITSSGVWADDARVVSIIASKRIAEIGETPGARIRVRTWTPSARHAIDIVTAALDEAISEFVTARVDGEFDTSPRAAAWIAVEALAVAGLLGGGVTP